MGCRGGEDRSGPQAVRISKNRTWRAASASAYITTKHRCDLKWPVVPELVQNAGPQGCAAVSCAPDSIPGPSLDPGTRPGHKNCQLHSVTHVCPHPNPPPPTGEGARRASRNHGPQAGEGARRATRNHGSPAAGGARQDAAAAPPPSLPRAPVQHWTLAGWGASRTRQHQRRAHLEGERPMTVAASPRSSPRRRTACRCPSAGRGAPGAPQRLPRLGRGPALTVTDGRVCRNTASC